MLLLLMLLETTFHMSLSAVLLLHLLLVTTFRMALSTVLSCHANVNFQICDSGALQKSIKTKKRK